jgi:predicted AAA+ superfamily ATPase
MIQRALLAKIADQCFMNKAILLLGARQVGKTTLLKNLVETLNVKTKWLNADEADIYNELTAANTSTALLQLIGPETKLAIIDEAQQIADIGLKLKLLHDNKPELQMIATGSSAFDLLNRTNEPLTGRKRTFYLYPISYAELVANTDRLEAKRTLEARLIFGSYPEVINNPGTEKNVLIEIAQSYLYKDILQLEGIRKSSHLEKLLQALAFQVGNEVNYHEISKTIGNINSSTVEKYLDLLEKTYVIYKLPALSRNMRSEIKKGKKYYFYDNGIRNVLISNYSPVEMRFDKGALWENFLISERLKRNHYVGNTPNTYFWRTHDQAEIDYIEEQDGVLNAFEFKWKEDNVRFPDSFLKAYPNHQTQLINRDNFESFVGGGGMS